jgi:hypothetical protein
MKSILNLQLIVLVLFPLTACTNAARAVSATSIPTVEQTNPKIFGVFEGITPCSKETRPLSLIPEDTDCEEMIWKFMLFQDPSSEEPTTFELTSSYGLSQQNSTGLVNGGTHIKMKGTWEIITGKNFEVYRLDPDTPDDAEPVSFAKIGNDVLHVLNKDGTLMVGHAGWSYTINRTDNRPHEPITNAGSVPLPDGTPVVPTMRPDVSVLGVFEGRTPCHDLVFNFTGTPRYTNCLKVKWQLTLYQNDAGEPAGYLFRGTSSVHQGTWTILERTKENPQARVYQLTADNEKNMMSFLSVDGDHLFLLDENLDLLVGDALFSYTLSRVEKP